MPVTAKLSQRFYEKLGDEVTTELVDWFNAVDATYRDQLKELNELNFERFRAELRSETSSLRGEINTLGSALRGEMNTMRAELRAEFHSGLADLRGELLKWMFIFWAGTTVPLAALIVAASGVFTR